MRKILLFGIIFYKKIVASQRRHLAAIFRGNRCQKNSNRKNLPLIEVGRYVRESYTYLLSIRIYIYIETKRNETLLTIN